MKKEECNQQELQHPNLACAFDDGRESDGPGSDGRGSDGRGSDGPGSDGRESENQESEDQESKGQESDSQKSDDDDNGAGETMEIHYNQLKNCYCCASVCGSKQTKQDLKIEQQVDGAVDQVYEVECWDFDDTWMVSK